MYTYEQEKTIKGIEGVVATIQSKIKATNNLTDVCPLHNAIYKDIVALAKSLKLLAREAQHWQE